MSPVPGDRDVRARAIEATSNVVVTAGAGTGKTTLLVDTVLHRILERGVDVRRILMLTFTEKAANEMRVRVREALEKRERTDRVTAALASLDRARIGTIHGFCTDVLREFPVEAGVDPHFQPDKGSHADEIFEREWEQWLATELRTDAPRRDAWLRVLKETRLDELHDVARQLCSFRVPDSALGGTEQRGRDELKGVREAVAARVKEVAARCSEANRLVDQMLALASFLKSGGDAGFLQAKLSEQKKGWGDAFPVAAQTASVAQKLARDIAEMDEPRVSETVSLLSAFARSFRDTFTAEGFVSFDGLLTLAHRVLTSLEFPGIRARLRERFETILVDEFQDTDPVQCEIIDALARDARKELTPGRLFIVGDPKQSIYSFRGADIVAYTRVKRAMIAAGAPELVLRTNFRSHAGILDVVNGVFENVIREREDLQPPYEAIDPATDRKTPPGPTVELALIEKEEGELSAEESRIAEAEYIAKWIRSNALRPRDVAILFRALSDAHIYLDALREHGIQYVVEGEKFFYGSQEIVSFYNLLAAVADPNDGIALVGVLRSPVGACDDRLILDLREEGALDWRRTPRDPRVKQLYRELGRLHALSKSLRPAQLVDEILSSTFVLELAAAGFTGEQAVANLLKLRAKAREQEAPGLGPLLRSMREAIRELEEEGESPLADETLDAVRVMSIHKAKGLEFPVVVLPDLHRQASGGHEKPVVRYDWTSKTLGVRLGGRPDAGSVALEYGARERESEESKRLPYVALTRPKERLLLLGKVKPARSSMQALLAEAIRTSSGDDVDLVETVARAGRGRIAVKHVTWSEPSRGERREKRKQVKADDLKGRAKAWKKRVDECAAALETPVFVRPSQLNEHRAIAASEDNERRESAIATGTACHRALETCDFKKPRFDAVSGEAREILDSFAKSKGWNELAKAEIVARELPFLMERDGGILNGAIDVVYRIGKKLWVGDYKTDRAERPEDHAEQGRAYVEAVARILGEKPAGFKLIYLRTGRIVTL